jgi:CheY-like chemotaxis protein
MPAQQPPTTAGQAIKLDNLSVLVVDDQANARMLIRTMLRAFRISRIVEAEDAASGYMAYQAQDVDIVLTDWWMPSMDGIELVRKIRRSSVGNPYIPIIMISGFSERAHVMVARDAGITEYLSKPLSVASLFQKLVTIVEKPRRFVKCETYLGPDRRRKAGQGPNGTEHRGNPQVGALPGIITASKEVAA